MNLNRRELFKAAARVCAVAAPSLALMPRLNAQSWDGSEKSVIALREHVRDCVRGGRKDIWIKGHHRLSSEAIERLGDTIVGWGKVEQKTLLRLPSGFRLIGDGPTESSLVLDGSAPVTLISIVDAASVTVEGISFVGNSRERSASFPGAIHLLATERANRALTDFNFNDLQFENFKSAAWCKAENFGTELLSEINIKRNAAVSRSGNLRGPNQIGADNDVWAFCGNVHNPKGLITKISIEDMVVHGEWLKCAVSFWSCVNSAQVKRLFATNIGKNAAFDTASYAVKLYSNHWYVNSQDLWNDRRFFPDNIHVLDSTVIDARSAGVYFASAGRVVVQDSVFKGQNDRSNQTEPRGCIAGPGCVELICEGNVIEDAFSGIDWYPKVGNDSSAIIRDNSVTTIRDNGIGIKVRTTLDQNRNGRVHVIGNLSRGTETGSRGLLIQYSDEFRFSEVAVESNVLRGDYADAEILYAGPEDPVRLDRNCLLSGNFKRTNMATWPK